MLSVEKCREILGVQEEEVNDNDIEEFQMMLRNFMKLMLDEELREWTP